MFRGRWSWPPWWWLAWTGSGSLSFFIQSTILQILGDFAPGLWDPWLWRGSETPSMLSIKQNFIYALFFFCQGPWFAWRWVAWRRSVAPSFFNQATHGYLALYVPCRHMRPTAMKRKLGPKFLHQTQNCLCPFFKVWGDTYGAEWHEKEVWPQGVGPTKKHTLICHFLSRCARPVHMAAKREWGSKLSTNQCLCLFMFCSKLLTSRIIPLTSFI